MDKRLLFTNDLDSNNKLTRTGSFSELSLNKITHEQLVRTATCGDLVRQISYEEIFNAQSNTRQVKMSQSIKSDKEEFSEIWKYTVPRQSSLKECEWPSTTNKGCHIQKQLSVPIQYVTRANSDTSSSRSILAPAKLIIGKNTLQQSQSCQILSSNDTSTETNNFNKQPLLDKSTVNKPLSLDKQIDNLTSSQSFIKPETTMDNKMTDKKDKEKGVFNQDNNNDVKVKPKRDIYELKKTLRSLVKKDPKRKSKGFTIWSIAFSILLPIAVINLAFFLNNVNISKEFCNPTLKIHKVAEELRTRIYGQDEAVDKIIHYFMNRENWTGFDIAVLVGGTGVGKSYTFDIIKSSMKSTSHFLDFFPPIYKKENQAYTLLSACRCNLIRLENLKTEDIPDLIIFSNDLRKRVKNYCVIILAMVNPQVTDHNLKRTLDVEKSVSLIEAKLKEADFQPTVIGFSPINEKALMKCIKDAANYANVELSIQEMDHVKYDLLTSGSGCKGAYAKVQIVGKNKQGIS